MSKPMVVTLPFVLLLLDFWPLERFSSFKSHVSVGKPSTMNLTAPCFWRSCLFLRWPWREVS